MGTSIWWLKQELVPVLIRHLLMTLVDVCCHLPIWQLPANLQTSLFIASNSTLLSFSLFSFNNFSLNLRTSIAPNLDWNTSLHDTTTCTDWHFENLFQIRLSIWQCKLYFLFYFTTCPFSLFPTACLLKCFPLLFCFSTSFLFVALINLKCQHFKLNLILYFATFCI